MANLDPLHPACKDPREGEKMLPLGIYERYIESTLAIGRGGFAYVARVLDS